MAVNVKAITPSQWASALAHLDRRDEWRHFWRDGVRYVSIISGRSNRLYVVRADAKSCSCPWNEQMWQRCAHMIAQELAALEADLIESRDEQDAAVRAAELIAAPRKGYADIFPPCRGCGDLCDGRDGFCDRCSSEREWQARRAG